MVESEPMVQGEASSPGWEGGALLRAGIRLGHMRLVVALAEHEQIRAAASVLNISQPAASRMLAETEAILGAPLATRHSRGMRLTPYGEAFARRARKILFELREIDREIADLRTGHGGSVSLGAVTAPAIELAVPAIAAIRELHPNVEISVQVETSNVLAKELIASRLDFYIGRIPDDHNPRLFESRELGPERACFMVREGHPLAGRGRVPLEMLTRHDWVLQPSGTLLRLAVEAEFLSRGVRLPERILSTSSVLLLMVMVARTDAIAPVATAVADFISGAEGLGGRVRTLETEVDVLVKPYSLIMMRDRALPPGAQTLYDLVLAEAEAQGVGMPVRDVAATASRRA